MRKINHIGIPTDKEQSAEIYLEGIKCYITDFNESPNKIEWLRFEDGSDFPELIQKSAHIAYEVENLEEELKGKNLLVEPFDSNENLTIAFIEEEGAPIELMHFH
ncbi:MAG: hypothetical protein MI784_12610 [Cytophagales bacterium]|nr:hypothetical protein [Cytophagales bacterium]